MGARLPFRHPRVVDAGRRTRTSRVPRRNVKFNSRLSPIIPTRTGPGNLYQGFWPLKMYPRTFAPGFVSIAWIELACSRANLTASSSLVMRSRI